MQKSGLVGNLKTKYSVLFPRRSKKPAISWLNIKKCFVTGLDEKPSEAQAKQANSNQY